MSKKITDFLKSPLSSGRIKPISSLFVFCCSIFVNAYFQISSFSALVQWLLKIYDEENAAEHLSEILVRTDIPIGMRLAFGLLMSVFVIIFLLIAAYLEEQSKNIGHLFERACSTMIVPMLLLFAAALLMNISLALGVLFGIAAAVSCIAVIISSGKRTDCNGYVLILISTAFFMITVVLLTRNHIVTMIG